MCGRFVSATDADGLVRFFSVDDRKADDLPPSWNVAPTDEVYAVVEHQERRVLVSFRWGLVPHWADDERIGARMINARAETAPDKPAFREAFRRRRCLLPADGFYEWETLADGRKQPHFVFSPDGAPLALAGLWERWQPPSDDGERGRTVRSCTVLTTAAAPAVADLHDRMPVILPPAAWERWLDRDLQDPIALESLIAEARADLVTRPASPEANSVRNNHPGLITAK